MPCGKFVSGDCLPLARVGLLRFPALPLFDEGGFCRIELQAQALQFGPRRRVLPLVLRRLRLPGRLPFVQRPAGDQQLRFPCGELLGGGRMRATCVGLLHFPLMAFFSENRLRRLQFRAKALRFRLRRSEMLVALGGFGLPRCPLLLELPMPSFKVRLPRGQLFRFGRPTNVPLAALRFPLPLQLLESAPRCFQFGVCGLDFLLAVFAMSLLLSKLGIPARSQCRKFGLPAVELRLLLVQRAQPGLDFGELPLDRLLLRQAHFRRGFRLRRVNHFQVDAADAEAVAGLKHRFGESPAVEPRIGRPAADDRPLGSAKDEAVDRFHAIGPQAKRAVRARPDGTLARLQAHKPAVSRGAADAEHEESWSGKHRRFGLRSGHSSTRDQKPQRRGETQRTGVVTAER